MLPCMQAFGQDTRSVVVHYGIDASEAYENRCFESRLDDVIVLSNACCRGACEVGAAGCLWDGADSTCS